MSKHWEELRRPPVVRPDRLQPGDWQLDGETPRVELCQFGSKNVSIRFGSPRTENRCNFTPRGLRETAAFFIALADQIEGKS